MQEIADFLNISKEHVDFILHEHLSIKVRRHWGQSACSAWMISLRWLYVASTHVHLFIWKSKHAESSMWMKGAPTRGWSSCSAWKLIIIFWRDLQKVNRGWKDDPGWSASFGWSSARPHSATLLSFLKFLHNADGHCPFISLLYVRCRNDNHLLYRCIMQPSFIDKVHAKSFPHDFEWTWVEIMFDN